MDLNRVNSYLERVRQSEQITFPAPGGRYKVGVDLGTAYIVVVVLDEQDNPVACEKQAASVLQDGVVVDFTGAQRIVRELRQKLGARLDCELLNCSIAMPAGTESSIRTHQYVAEGAGFEVTSILDEPTAANAVYQIKNGVVVDIGGGTTEVAVLSLGGIVLSTSLRIAGDELDESIIAYIKRKYNILIGDVTAEMLKKRIGSVHPAADRGEMRVQGRNLLNGLPAIVGVSSAEIREAMEDQVQHIVESIRTTLENTPPELAADIYDTGIMLSGGGAMLAGLPLLISRITGIRTVVAKSPIDSVVTGIGRIIESDGISAAARFRSR